jgi:predicted phosphodiesterase
MSFRVAILADIHGNLPAFEAALNHAADQNVDQIIVAGDIVIGAPDSIDCWKLALSLNCPILRGNHERYVAHYGTALASPEWSTEKYSPLQWAVSQLESQDCQAMDLLPTNLRLPDAQDLFIVHASEGNDSDTVVAHTPEEQLSVMFPSAKERYIIRAHNHVGQTRVWKNRFIVTAGSVVLPLDGNPTAQYLILDQEKGGWQIKHQSVPYPLEVVIQRFKDTQSLASTGPMGRLFFREVVKASQQLVPFLRLYKQWSKEGNISLRACKSITPRNNELRFARV